MERKPTLERTVGANPRLTRTFELERTRHSYPLTHADACRFANPQPGLMHTAQPLGDRRNTGAWLSKRPGRTRLLASFVR
jgi:hypothetical protein